jgi:NADPH:quinone reductase-like Zn-dependent oxidoreductase
MKAIRIHGRGGPEQLVYEDALKPIPQRGEALVRVMAAGVTPTELSWSSAYATRDKADRLQARAAEYGVRGVSFIVKPSRQQLTTIQELIDRGAIWPVVSAVFPLAQARQAFERGIAGHTRGKMVLSILSGQDQTQPSVRVST